MLRIELAAAYLSYVIAHEDAHWRNSNSEADWLQDHGGDGAMNTVKEKLARGLNAFTRPQVVSLIIVTAVFLILFKESIQTATIIVGFCSVADPDIANHV